MCPVQVPLLKKFKLVPQLCRAAPISLCLRAPEHTGTTPVQFEPKQTATDRVTDKVETKVATNSLFPQLQLVLETSFWLRIVSA